MPRRELTYCERCGVASQSARHDLDGRRGHLQHPAALTRGYRERPRRISKPRPKLHAVIDEIEADGGPASNDCIVMASAAARDSAYMLYQLCALGVPALVVFTLDKRLPSPKKRKRMCAASWRLLGGRPRVRHDAAL
jgi:hypothetical protein